MKTLPLVGPRLESKRSDSTKSRRLLHDHRDLFKRLPLSKLRVRGPAAAFLIQRRRPHWCQKSPGVRRNLAVLIVVVLEVMM
jgi:hypothetical protein